MKEKKLNKKKSINVKKKPNTTVNHEIDYYTDTPPHTHRNLSSFGI